MYIAKSSLALCLAAVSALLASTEARAFTNHKLAVEVDVEARTLRGTDTVTAGNAADRLELVLRKDSSLDSAELGGAPVEYRSAFDKKRRVNVIKIALPPDAAGKELTLAFHGAFEGIEAAMGEVRRGVAHVTDGFIDRDGAFISSSSAWYPREEGEMASFELRSSAPEGYTTVSEGDWSGSARENGRAVDSWKVSTPMEGIDLVVGKYAVTEKAHGKIKLYTFLLKDDPALARLYLEKSGRYIDLYSGMIAPYPYGKFAVVEGPLPTGYGMPSFTLLGSSVIRLPFIPDTSLGHEIAHNWWGNSVFVSDAGGNWSEALATYTADYLQAVEKGEDAELRLSKLKGYKSFARPRPARLKDLYDSASQAGRAVTYNKGLMVLVMLKSLVGQKAFDAGLKTFYADNAFKRASWDDLRAAFEKASRDNLGWFFDQWVDRAGAPALRLDGAEVERVENGGKVRYRAVIRLRQTSPLYRMKLPVVFSTAGGDKTREILITKASEEFEFDFDKPPLAVAVDPGHANMRLLDDEETPPSFAGILGNSDAVIVVPQAEPAKTKYLPAAETLRRDYGMPIVTDNSVSARGSIYKGSAIILGGKGENAFFDIFKESFDAALSSMASPAGADRKFAAAAVALANRNAPTKVIGVFVAGNASAEEGVKRLRYFAEESFVVFREDGGVEKGRAGASRPLSRALAVVQPIVP